MKFIFTWSKIFINSTKIFSNNLPLSNSQSKDTNPKIAVKYSFHIFTILTFSLNSKNRLEKKEQRGKKKMPLPER